MLLARAPARLRRAVLRDAEIGIRAGWSCRIRRPINRDGRARRMRSGGMPPAAEINPPGERQIACQIRAESDRRIVIPDFGFLHAPWITSDPHSSHGKTVTASPSRDTIVRCIAWAAGGILARDSGMNGTALQAAVAGLAISGGGEAGRLLTTRRPARSSVLARRSRSGCCH